MRIISNRREPSENIFSAIVEDIEFAKHTDSELREFKKAIALQLVNKIVDEFFERNKTKYEEIINSQDFRDLVLNHLASQICSKFISMGQ